MDGVSREPRAEPALAERTRDLAAGEETAWHWFHQRYYLALLRYAAQRSGDPSAASEIVQQAYLRIARHVRPFVAEADFWGWLCCVVRCAAVDHARHITRRSVLLEKFAHWRATRSGDDSAWPPSAGHASHLAEEALAQLPGDDAALLRAKYCDGLSTRELAAAHGTTVKAIENRLARLRERLREIILRLR